MSMSDFPVSPMGQRKAQSGVVLLLALIVLIAMAFAGLALMRSVGTANLVAGNLAFQQAATRSADRGIETAIGWIENNGTLLANDAGLSGYAANGLAAVAGRNIGETWSAYWTRVWSPRQVQIPTDVVGNTVFYVIDRLCQNAGAPTSGANCSTSPVVTQTTANSEEAGEVTAEMPSRVYYRITTRVTGPRNTSSFVQAIVAR